MSKLTKFFAMFFIAVMAAAMLAACGGDSSSQASEPASIPEASSQISEPASAPTASSQTPAPASVPGSEPSQDVTMVEDGQGGNAADIDTFIHDGFIYMRADTYPGMDPVDVSTLTKGEEVLKITTNDEEARKTVGYASVLPVGTAVYAAQGQPSFLIAEVDGEDILYVQVMEME